MTEELEKIFAEFIKNIEEAVKELLKDLQEIIEAPAPTPPPVEEPLVDSNGDVWAISSEGKVTKNGLPATDPDYTANVVELILYEDIPYHANAAGDWYKWSGQPNWTSVPGDPREQVPTPSPTPAPGLPAMVNGEYVSKGFTVPPHFLGMHLNHFPEDNYWENPQHPSKAPIIQFKNVNDWDYAGRSPGVHMISEPGFMDTFMNYWKGKGAFILDTPALMPKEVATDQKTDGPYNWPGCTAGLNFNKRAQYKNAAKARLTRYKGTIKVINPMNEPDFGYVAANADFFRGDMANAAEIFSVWREAIDEVDPSIILLGNSAVFWGYQDATGSEQFNRPFDRFTQALGTKASNGKRVVDMVDAVAIHHYGQAQNSIYSVVTCVERARATLKALNAVKDVWITECGFINGQAPDVNGAIATMKKWVAAGAISQAKGLYLYSYDGGNFQYMSENPELQNTFAELQSKYNGKKVKESKIRADGTAKIVFEDGTTIEV